MDNPLDTHSTQKTAPSETELKIDAIEGKSNAHAKPGDVGHPATHNADELTKTVTTDHEEVRKLISEYEQQADFDSALEKARQVCAKLVSHAGKEEIAWYPMLRDILPQGDNEASNVKSEHQEMTEAMYEVESSKDMQQLRARMARLITDFNRHSRDEETRILPLFGRECTREQGEEVMRRWNRAVSTTHPHPSAPHEGMLAQAAHLVAYPVDKLRDAMHASKEKSKDKEKDEAHSSSSSSSSSSS